MDAVYDSHNIPKYARLPMFGGWLGITHNIDGRYWILIDGNYWRDATDSQLRGVLGHELAHAEAMDIEGTGFGLINGDDSDLAFICNERVTDLLTISKGLGPDLMAARLYEESRGVIPEVDHPK